VSISRLDALRGRVGAPPSLTEWERFDQAAVDAYGAITGENLWIHTDPARAAASAYGGTIVPSSLLMARFGAWLQAVGLWLPEPATPLNYGYDRIRVPGSLRVGAAVRGRLALTALTEDRPGAIGLTLDARAEGEDGAKPIIVATWRVMFLFGPN